MPKAQLKPTAPRGGPVNVWIPGPLKADLTRLKAKLGVSWSGLFRYLYEKAAVK